MVRTDYRGRTIIGCAIVTQAGNMSLPAKAKDIQVGLSVPAGQQVPLSRIDHTTRGGLLHELLRQEKYEVYMQRLIDAFNPQTVNDLMCRSLVSVDWKGYLYDCDFNQMLDLPLYGSARRLHISEVRDSDLVDRTIQAANHCYGCTAGCGSS